MADPTDRPTAARRGTKVPETPELRRLRHRIDALDRRIVGLLNERAELAREAGRAKTAGGRRAIRDAERASTATCRCPAGLMTATRALEASDRARDGGRSRGRGDVD